MKFSLLLLASLPAALASLAYTPPAGLAAQAKDPKNRCVLPADFHIRNFVAQANGTEHGNGHGHRTGSFKFTYVNTATNSSTTCEYGPGSKRHASDKGRGLPRYKCKSKDVSFIWQYKGNKLSMIQQVCPDAHGHANYEVSGAVKIPLSCIKHTCQGNATDLRGVFTSLNPVRHDRVIRHKRGVAWSYGLED